MGVGYWKDAPRRSRDVAQAKALLQQAGVSGAELRLTAANTQNDRTAAQVIQSNLADIASR